MQTIGYSALQVIPTAKGFGPALSALVNPEMSVAGITSGRIFGAGMVKGLEATSIIGITAAITGALFKTGSTFNEMEDTIRVGTGATGKSLQTLVTDATNIGKQVPASFADIGNAVVGINNRLGLTGPTLETFTKQFLEAGRITKQALDLDTITGALTVFNIKGEATVGAMDSLFQVSQATGTGINTLADAMKSGAPVLQQFGFGWRDSAAFLGILDKAGVTTETTLMALKIGLVEFAKAGRDPEAALKATVAQIQDLLKVGKDAAAIKLADSIFGARGATQFVAAVKSGKVNLDEMFASLHAGSDTIIKAGEETQHFSEQWGKLRNNVMISVKPAADAIFKTFTDGMRWLDTNGVPILQSVSHWLGDNHGWLTKTVVILGSTFLAWKALLIIQSVTTAVGLFGVAVMDGTIALKAMYGWEALVASLNPFGWVALAITGLVALNAELGKLGTNYGGGTSSITGRTSLAGINAGIGQVQVMHKTGIAGPHDSSLSIQSQAAQDTVAKIAADKQSKLDKAAAIQDAKDRAAAAALKAAAALQAKLQLLTSVEDQKKIMQDFARYLTQDFPAAIVDGSKKAVDIITGLVGQVGSAVSGYAATIADKTKADTFTLGATKITNSMETKLFGFQGTLDDINKARTNLVAQIADAESALKDAQALRIEASSGIAKLLSTPFGTPSELTKAFTGANASVDTIISGYDNLVKLVNDRFSKIDGPNKNFLLDFLKKQSTRLVDLASTQVKLVDGSSASLADALKLSQTAFDDAKAAAKDYATSVAGNLKTAGHSLSEFVTSITLWDGQTAKMTASPQTLIATFAKRLTAMKSFSDNVKSLAARGLGKDVIDQIAGMGVENGGILAASLTTVSDAEIAALQQSSVGITQASDDLGTTLSSKFYDNGINAALSIRDGLKSQQDSIDLQMTSITNSITDKLAPLVDGMSVIGSDAAQSLLDGFKSQDAALLGQAKAIGAQMAQAVADALASLNLLSGGNNFGVGAVAAKETSAKLQAEADAAAAKAKVDAANKAKADAAAANAAAIRSETDARTAADLRAAADYARAHPPATSADIAALADRFENAMSGQARTLQRMDRQGGV